MLDPPSRTSASTRCCAISARAFSMRAWRSASAIGTMPAVIGLSAAMAGWTPGAPAGAAALSTAAGEAAGLLQPAAAAPAARADDWRKRRREGVMAREGITADAAG